MFHIEFIVPHKKFMSTGGIYENRDPHPHCISTKYGIFYF